MHDPFGVGYAWVQEKGDFEIMAIILTVWNYDEVIRPGGSNDRMTMAFMYGCIWMRGFKGCIFGVA